jgi:hypothetical protein
MIQSGRNLQSNRQFKFHVDGALNLVVWRLLLTVAICLSALFLAVAPATSTRFWLVWIAFMPLFIAIRSQPLGIAAFLGALWGCCLCLFAAHYESVSSIPFINFCLITGAPCFYVVLSKTFIRRFGYNPLALALGWIVFEFIYARLGAGRIIFLNNENLGSFFHVFADFLGYGFIGFIIAYVNAVLLSITIRMFIAGDRALLSTINIRSQWQTIFNETRLLCPYHISIIKPRAPPWFFGEGIIVNGL